MLLWREKVNYNELSSKEKVAFDLKLALRKHYKGYKLTNFKGEVNFSPVGSLIKALPSCLNPSAKVKRGEKILATPISDYKCLCELADNYPIELDFYPSDEILEKLVMLSLQISDPEKELWEGFY